VSYVCEGSRRFAVTVRLSENERALSRIKEITVATPSGAFIPLQEIASFNTVSGAMNIAREGGQRVVSVGVFIKDRDMGSVVKDMQVEVGKALKLQQGYQIFFNSLKNATLIISNIPFAMIGGIAALHILDIPLSVSAAIGFIALFGQAVLNGVVMLSHFGQLQENGSSLYEAVVQGSVDRLRTVLMTALLASLGLFPMAISTAIGSETQRPLAIVIIGGLISATLLTLVVLPSLYYWAHRKKPTSSEIGLRDQKP
jgi:heavy metal efflux system protein